MNRLLVLAAGVVLVSTSCSNRTDGALRVRVTLDAAVAGDCVELTASSGGTVLAASSAALARPRLEYVFAVKQGDLPAAVTLLAATYSGRCQDTATRKLAARSAPVEHTFPAMGIDDVSVPLGRPDGTLDADRDGYIDQAKGGGDCNDTRSDIHPGAQQTCGSTEDTNCNGLLGCADDDCAATPPCAHPAATLAFDPATATPLYRGNCSGAFAVTLRDAAGQAAQAARDVAVTVEPGNASLTVYADAACTGAPLTGPLTVPYGQSRTPSLYVKGAATGDVALSARASGLALASLTVHVIPQPIDRLVFTATDPLPLKAGECSPPLTVQFLDATGLATTAGADLRLALDQKDLQSGVADPGFEFFGANDLTCGTHIIDAVVVVPAGESTASFRVRARRALLPSLDYAVTAQDTAPHVATRTVRVSPSEPVRVVFANGAVAPRVNTCSNVIRAQVLDAQDNVTKAPMDLALTLDGTPLTATGGVVTVFGNSACSGTPLPGGAFRVGAGVSTGDVWVKASVVGTYTLRLQGLSTATQGLSVGAGPPTHLVPTTGLAQSLPVDTCSATVTVEAQDATNVMSGPQGPITIAIATPPGFQVFAGPGCVTAAGTGNTLALDAGQGSVAFSYRAITSVTAGALTASTTEPGIGPGSTTATITPGGPHHLTWGATPGTLSAGACSAAFPLRIEDSHGNATTFGTAPGTLDLTSTPGPAGSPVFSLDAACASPGLSLAVANGATALTLYATATLASGTPYALSATLGGKSTTAPASLLVGPGSGTQLVFKTPPTTPAQAGACAQVDVERRDAQQNPAPVTATAAVPVTLGATFTGALAPQYFGSLANCQAGTGPLTQVSMAQGQALVTAWVRGRTVGAATLTAAAPSLTTGTAPLAVTPGPTHHLTLSLSNGSVPAGTCVTGTVTRLDAFNNPIGTDAQGQSFTASSDDVQATFFTDGGCGTAGGPGFSIGTLQSQATFGVMPKTKAAATLVRVSATGLADATATLAVTAEAPDHFTWSAAAPTTVVAGVCTATAFTLNILDKFGNATSYPASTPITFTPAPAGLGTPTVSGAANCNGAGATVSANASDTSVAVYVTGTLVGSYTLAPAAGTVVGPASSTLAITPAPGKHLAFVAGLPATAPAGTCTQLDLAHRDQFDNLTPVTPASGVTLTLTSTLASGPAPDFFPSAAACGAGTGAITTLLLPRDATGGSVWVRGRGVGAATLGATLGGYQAATGTYTVTHGTQDHVAVTLSTASAKAGACVTATVTRYDTWNNLVTTNGNQLTYTATSSDVQAVFFTSPTCAVGTVTPAPIGGNQATVTFGVQLRTKAAPTTVTATPTVAGVLAGSATLTVTAEAPDHLTWAPGGPSTVVAGGCTGTAFTLNILDKYENATTFGAATPIAFTPAPVTAGPPVFATSAACTGAAGTVSTATNATTLVVYATGTIAGAYSVSAAAGAVGTLAPAALSITPSVGKKLAFIAGLPGSAAAGVCTQVDVSHHDLYDNVTPVTAAAGLTLNLTSALASGQPPDFFGSLATCQAGTPAVTTLGLPLNATQGSFWVRGRSQGTATVGAALTGYTSASGTLTVTHGTQDHVTLALPASVKAGGCAVATITRYDAWNNLVTTDGNQLTYVATTSDALGLFFANPTCTGGASAPTAILGNQASTTFGFSPRTKVASASVTVTPAVAGVAAGTATLGVTGGDPFALAFLTTPVSLVPLQCSNAIDVELHDAWGNVTTAPVAYDLTFSSNATQPWVFRGTCGGPVVTKVTMAAGASQATFTFTGQTAETANLTLTVSATTPPPTPISASQAWTIVPGAAAALVWKTAPLAALTRYACAANPGVLQMLDAGGNAVPFPAATLRFTSSAAGAALQFYGDAAACLNRLGPSPATLAVSAGTTQVPVMLASLGTGATNVVVADNAAIAAFTATPAVAVSVFGPKGALATAAPATPLEAGDCAAVTVSRADSGSTPATVGLTPLAIGTSNAEVTLHADATCDPAAPVTTAVIPDGAASVTFYARGRGGAGLSVNVTASDSDGYFNAAPTATVTPLPLVRRGTLSFLATDFAKAATVAIPNGDVSRSFLAFQARVDSLDASESMVTCGLTTALGVSSVSCRRVALVPTKAVTVEWQVVSFGARPGVSVQHFSGNAILTTVSPIAQPITIVPDATSFVLFSHAANDVGVLAQDFATARLARAVSGAGTFDRLFLDFDTNLSPAFSWDAQVVTFPGATVDTGSGANVSGATYTTGPLASRALGQLLPLFSSRSVAYTGLPTPETTEACKHRWHLQSPTATTLTFTRGDPGLPTSPAVCTSVNTAELAWQRITFPSWVSVASYDASITGGGTATNVGITGVTVNRAVAVLGGMGPSGLAGGETLHTSSNLGYSTASATFNTPSQVTVTRAASAGGNNDSLFTFFVVQFSP